jgi:hypothetical protein
VFTPLVRTPSAPPPEPGTWHPLYRLAALAAIGLVVLTILHSAVFFVVGLPSTVPDWFALYARNPVGGLLAFELLMVLYVVVSVPVVLALGAALWRAAPSLAALYVALALVGTVAFIAARPAFEMLSLANGYAAATTEAQRSAFLAAGEVTVAVFHGTAFWTSYLLGSAGGVVLAVAILRTGTFSRTAAGLRLASSVFDLGLFVPGIGLGIALLSVVCLLGFNLLAARRLWTMSREGPAPRAGHAAIPAMGAPAPS